MDDVRSEDGQRINNSYVQPKWLNEPKSMSLSQAGLHIE